MILGNFILKDEKIDVAKIVEERGFPAWLEVATHELEPVAKERVRKELEGHYADSVAAHIAAGQDEDSARKLALTELGDAEAAAKQLQKNYLTESEVKWLGSIEEKANRPFLLFQPFDIVRLITLPVLTFLVKSPLDQIILLCGYGVGIGLSTFVPRRPGADEMSPDQYLQILALREFAASVVLGITIGIGTEPRSSNWDFLWAVFFMFMFSFSVTPAFRVWNKLRKMPGSARDQFPQQPVAS